MAPEGIRVAALVLIPEEWKWSKVAMRWRELPVGGSIHPLVGPTTRTQSSHDLTSASLGPMPVLASGHCSSLLPCSYAESTI